MSGAGARFRGIVNAGKNTRLKRASRRRVCSGSTAGEAWRVRRMGLWSFLTELVPLTLLALQV